MGMTTHRIRNRRQRGFSLIELLIVIAIILVIAAIAAPNLNRARMHAQEMAAIRQIGTIHTAQQQYFSQFGRFAQSLKELGPGQGGSGGASGPSAADLIPGDLAEGTKTGFKFTLSPGKDGYVVTAVPVAFNTTGRRTFYSDQSLVIRENWTAEPATAQSSEIK
jgi:type IV pilus assembly protein PilA